METLTDCSVEIVEQSSKQIVGVTARMLEQLCDTDCPEPSDIGDELYRSPHCPDISISDYCARLKEYSRCHSATWIISMIYLDRRSAITGRSTTHLTVHRLLLTSLVCAIKRWEDTNIPNKFYAQVGGVETKELNKLELEFLFVLDWDLDVTPESFDKYFSSISYITSPNVENDPNFVTEGENNLNEAPSVTSMTDTLEFDVMDNELADFFNYEIKHSEEKLDLEQGPSITVAEPLAFDDSDNELAESFNALDVKHSELFLSDTDDVFESSQFSLSNVSPQFISSYNTPLLSIDTPHHFDRSLYSSTPRPYQPFEFRDASYRSCGDDDFSRLVERSLPYIY